MKPTDLEDKTDGFNRQVGFIEVVWFVLAGVFILLIYAYWASFSQYGWSTNPDAWGQFGDFLGGVLNPLVSLTALFALVISVRMQRTELNNTRAELIEARKVASEQAKTADQQRREQRFFDLLNLYQKTVDSLSFQVGQNIFIGKAAIAHRLETIPNMALINRFDKTGYIGKGTIQFEPNYEVSKLSLKNNWDNPDISNFIDQYFRVIYRILSEAEALLGKDHTRYVKLLRAQLNRNELTLLAYNMWLDDEGIKMRPLAAKYRLLKHLPDGHLKTEMLKEVDSAIFGTKRETK